MLADPTRLRIVALIAVRARRSSAIATELGISRSAASRHLRVLSEAGLVLARSSVVDGRWRSYMSVPEQLGRITAWLAGTRLALDEDLDLASSYTRKSTPGFTISR